MYKIAVDVMSGEKAPEELIKGAVNAAKEEADIELTLIGRYDIINQELAKLDIDKNRVKIEKADQIINMDEAPIKALKKKKMQQLMLVQNYLDLVR